MNSLKVPLFSLSESFDCKDDELDIPLEPKRFSEGGSGNAFKHTMSDIKVKHTTHR
jgi:hypothetical protein